MHSKPLVTFTARLIHAALSETCLATGEPPYKPFDEADEKDREASVKGAELALSGGTARQSHETWMKGKLDDGWTLGPTDKPNKVHDCLVPYDDLPPRQRVKDEVPERCAAMARRVFELAGLPLAD